MGLSLHHKANLSCCFSISRFLQPPNSSLPFSRAKNVSPLSHALKDEFYNAVVCQYEIDSVSSLRFCPWYQIVTATHSGDDCWLTVPRNNSAGIVERVTQLRCIASLQLGHSKICWYLLSRRRFPRDKVRRLREDNRAVLVYSCLTFISCLWWSFWISVVGLMMFGTVF